MLQPKTRKSMPMSEVDVINEEDDSESMLVTDSASDSEQSAKDSNEGK